MGSKDCVARPRVLLVDDIELNCILTGAVLEQAGYEVESVGSGKAALAAIETRSFDLILLDIEMPDLDGHRAAALIQQRERGATRLAALSFRGDQEARERSRELGLEAHICRPLKPDELIRRVNEILQRPLPDVGDPWQRSIYKEFAARLGVERMQGFLNRMHEHFAALLSLLEDNDGDALRRLAHDIASTGGMLGFMDVSNACRKLMEAHGLPDETGVRADLRAALLAARHRLAGHLSTVGALAA